MDLHARLRRALDPIPEGSLVPVEWVRGIVEECGGSDVDLTVEDVGELLDRAPSTIRTWCGCGKLPGAYRLQGREWRIPRGALQALREEERGERGEAPVDLGRWRRHVGGGEL